MPFVMAPDDPSVYNADQAPGSSAVLDLAAALCDAVADRTRRSEVLRATSTQLAAELGLRLSSSELAWLVNVLDDAQALCRHMIAAEAALATAALGVGAARLGLLGLDDRGLVCHANETAVRLLGVTLGAPSDIAVRAAAALDTAHEVDDKVVFRQRVSATRCLDFRRLPVPASSGAPYAGPAFTMSVTAVDTAPPSAATISKVLGITPAEARLCAELARGSSVAECAQRLGIRMPTARSQLRSVFAKTDTRRQAELMAILAALPVDLD